MDTGGDEYDPEVTAIGGGGHNASTNGKYDHDLRSRYRSIDVGAGEDLFKTKKS